MHVFFSGIGGTAIGPLALIAKEAGYEVSGSDKQDSQYLHYLQSRGIKDIHVGQDEKQIAKLHRHRPIDWLVYSSAVAIENPDAPELKFAAEHDIKTGKRDELLNTIISEKHLKLIAVAGTHGKTTTTAMVIWLFKQLELPVSYSVGAKISFGDMGQFDAGSEYFVYEADEFDRNFLAFWPYLSLITGVAWDHHEIFPTEEDYQQAFKQFLGQSEKCFLWDEDKNSLKIDVSNKYSVLNPSAAQAAGITLAGTFNRRDAWLAIQSVHEVTSAPIAELVEHINKFPGSQRRMEKIADNLYTDYAHTPEKIVAAMSVAREMLADGQKLVVIYEPLTNRRQHFIKEAYKNNIFSGASRLYWVPSYLAREDPNQPVLTPTELIKLLPDQSNASAAELNEGLRTNIQKHLDGGDMVVAMSGGGGNSLDEWLRANF